MTLALVQSAMLPETLCKQESTKKRFSGKSSCQGVNLDNLINPGSTIQFHTSFLVNLFKQITCHKQQVMWVRGKPSQIWCNHHVLGLITLNSFHPMYPTYPVLAGNGRRRRLCIGPLKQSLSAPVHSSPQKSPEHLGRAWTKTLPHFHAYHLSKSRFTACDVSFLEQTHLVWWPISPLHPGYVAASEVVKITLCLEEKEGMILCWWPSNLATPILHCEPGYNSLHLEDQSPESLETDWWHHVFLKTQNL